MLTEVKNGTIKEIDGRRRIYYDGYWIRHYAPPPESLAARRGLIERLKKRLFHHTERGINTPGANLEAARHACEQETDPARKRVNRAMLAGALFNRASDIFTSIVELEAKGVKISPENELMRQCGEYFQEALELGTAVKHYSGREGIDELWGEPFKVFARSIEDFYTSRYLKISQTMSAIDRIADTMEGVFAGAAAFEGVVPTIRQLGETAKLETETMRSDPAIFEVWPQFVATGEALLEFEAKLPSDATESERNTAAEGLRLIRDGEALLTYLAGVRTPMPKSTKEYLDRCETYRLALANPEFQPG